ncbi:MAG: DUF364 domain-containing protein [Chloroflexi bacterium]|nr:DUF364 domain-containing protein [Chloroflexota bacterium]
MITEKIQRLLATDASGARIADVRIGLGYTAVLLESGQAGVAYTLREDLRPGCSPFSGQRPLASRSAAELLSGLGSGDPLERTIGLATANALICRRGVDAFSEGDILDAVAFGPDDRVGMVGYFGPLIPLLQKRVASLTIFERNPARGAGLEPPERALDLLPECTVALITSSVLLTGTLDPLLQAAARCREIALLGPSTPLIPRSFADTGVTWLSGLVIVNAAQVLRVVSEGGGTREFSPFARKVNLQIRGG